MGTPSPRAPGPVPPVLPVPPVRPRLRPERLRKRHRVTRDRSGPSATPLHRLLQDPRYERAGATSSAPGQRRGRDFTRQPLPSVEVSHPASANISELPSPLPGEQGREKREKERKKTHKQPNKCKKNHGTAGKREDCSKRLIKKAGTHCPPARSVSQEAAPSSGSPGGAA